MASNGSASSQGAGASASGPGQTSDERRLAIDRRLSDSLGAFDAELKKEQQRLAQERDARQVAPGSSTAEPQSTDKMASTDPASTDQGGTDTSDAPHRGDRSGPGRNPGNSDSRSAHAGDLKSEAAAATGQGTAKSGGDNAGNGATAREIPDGSDDDIVARRLRKAAEQETDPELKEKLWQEYIEYKKNAPGK